VEDLRLPEPAGSLWKRIRGIVHDVGSRREGARIEPHLGGGTTLAARWGHRRSSDIDVTLPGDRSLADLTRNDDDNLARRIGGKADSALRAGLEVLRPDPRGAQGARGRRRPERHGTNG